MYIIRLAQFIPKKTSPTEPWATLTICTKVRLRLKVNRELAQKRYVYVNVSVSEGETEYYDVK